MQVYGREYKRNYHWSLDVLNIDKGWNGSYHGTWEIQAQNFFLGQKSFLYVSQSFVVFVFINYNKLGVAPWETTKTSISWVIMAPKPQNVGTKLTLHGSVVPQWRSGRANEGIEEFTHYCRTYRFWLSSMAVGLEATKCIEEFHSLLSGLPILTIYFRLSPKG